MTNKIRPTQFELLQDKKCKEIKRFSDWYAEEKGIIKPMERLRAKFQAEDRETHDKGTLNAQELLDSVEIFQDNKLKGGKKEQND